MNDQLVHHFMEDLLPMVVIPTIVIACAWVIGLIIAAFRHRANLRAQSDFQNRLLEKFSSSEEFTAYLQSEAGRGFFENLGNEPTAPMSRILTSIQGGVILTLLGIGFFLTRNVIGTLDSQNIMTILATMLTAVGAGFLISSAISYRLSKSWGLIAVDKKEISNQPSATAA